MKKVRIFVSAAAVLAVVGSALAFKPVNNGQVIYTPDRSGACTVQSTLKYVEDPAGSAFTASFTNGGTCQSLILSEDE